MSPSRPGSAFTQPLMSSSVSRRSSEKPSSRSYHDRSCDPGRSLMDVAHCGEAMFFQSNLKQTSPLATSISTFAFAVPSGSAGPGRSFAPFIVARKSSSWAEAMPVKLTALTVPIATTVPNTAVSRRRRMCALPHFGSIERRVPVELRGHRIRGSSTGAIAVRTADSRRTQRPLHDAFVPTVDRDLRARRLGERR